MGPARIRSVYSSLRSARSARAASHSFGERVLVVAWEGATAHLDMVVAWEGATGHHAGPARWDPHACLNLRSRCLLSFAQTMTAGAIFGTVPGTCVVSVAATIASTVAFLIAR